MDLEGSIASVDLVGFLVRLAQNGFMGAIRFEQGDTIKILYLREGNVIAASTNDHADSLDEILLRGGRVTREHVKQALARRKDDETLGNALLGLGFITRKELLWARRSQIVGVLRSVVDWSDGSYAVVHDHQPRHSDDVAFALEQIVVELIVTGKDRERIEKEFGGGERIFARAADFSFRYSRLDLNAEADRIVAKIDGERTTAEIAAAVTRDEFTVYKLLYALEVLGLLEERDKAQVSHEVLLPGVLRDEPPESVPPDELEAPVTEATAGGVSFEEIDFGERMDADLVPGQEKTDALQTETFEGIGEPIVEGGIEAMDEHESERPGEGNGEALDELLPPIGTEGEPPLETPLERTPDLWPERRSGIAGVPWALVGLVVLVVAVAAGWWAYEKYWVSKQAGTAASEGPRGGRIVMPPTPGEQAKPAKDDKGGKSDRSAAIAASGKTATIPPAVKKPSRRSVPLATTRPTPTRRTEPRRAEQQVAADRNDPLRVRYGRMASTFVKDADPFSYTIQFELVCETSSVTRAVDEGGSKIWFVPVQHGNRSCFRVFWGHYESVQSAERSIGEIPSRLRGGKPRVVRVGEVLGR